MAFSDNKITVADLTGKGVTGMADTPNLTTAQMQQKLDEIAKEVIPPKFNSLCDALDLLGLSSLLTSASTTKMLYLRLNEYDQLEYSVDDVDYSLIASGKEILDPSIEADNSKKLGGQFPAYYQKTTDSALNTTDKTTTGAINEIKTGLDNVDTTANEAPPYSPSSTYTLGKYVSHEKHIYECTTAIEVAEEWNASHWTQVTLGAEIETVNNSLTIHSTTFDGTASHSIGDYVIYTDNSILYLYKFNTDGVPITNATKVLGGVGVIVNTTDGNAYVMGADSVLKKCSGGGVTIPSIKCIAERPNSVGITNAIFNVADMTNVNIGSITLLGRAPAIYTYSCYYVQGSNDANFATADYLIPMYTTTSKTDVNLDVIQYDYIKIYMYASHEGTGGYVLFENIVFS